MPNLSGLLGHTNGIFKGRCHRLRSGYALRICFIGVYINPTIRPPVNVGASLAQAHIAIDVSSLDFPARLAAGRLKQLNRFQNYALRVIIGQYNPT